MMIKRCRPVIIAGIVVMCLWAGQGMAQPVLPNLAGKSGSGLVLLSWVCQFDGIKAITVLHSKDSTGQFQPIGNVKHLDKGVQAFVDGRPIAGRNFYKLKILFKSGVNWTSNRCSVDMTWDELAKYNQQTPSNDSLQRYLHGSGEVEDIRESIVRSHTPAPKPKPAEKPQLPPPPTAPPTRQAPISDKVDATTMRADSEMKPLTTPKPRVITLSFDDPTKEDATFIKSRFLSIDPVSGHISMNLPEDVSSHSYSIRFLNSARKLVTEIPKVTTQRMLLDRRNFQHRGVYKFIIRKDYTELESGFIRVE